MINPIGVKSGHSPSGPFLKSVISPSDFFIILLNPLVIGKKPETINNVSIKRIMVFFRPLFFLIFNHPFII